MNVTLCRPCQVTWVGDRSCWLCGDTGRPAQQHLTSYQVRRVIPLPRLPGDTDDPIFTPRER